MKKKFTKKFRQTWLTAFLLATITCSAVAQYTLTDDDVKMENGLITSCSYSFAETDIIIPETLNGETVVGFADPDDYNHSVFYNKGITSVILPATLTHIGEYTFYKNSLTSLDLSGCTALATIGEGAFLYNSFTSIDLSKCTALTYVGEDAFYRNSLSSLTLPMPAYANFEYWYDGDGNHYPGNSVVFDLKTSYSAYVPYNLTDDDLTVVNGVIIACSYSFALTDVIIPETLDNQTVIGIADGDDYKDGVFYNKGITYARLPATLENIGKYAFYENSLINLDLSNCTALKTIGEEAFSTNNLDSLDLSGCATLTTIGDYAFGYNDITSLDIHGCTALATIGENAFYSNEITYVDLSGCTALTNIGEYAFRGNSITGLNLSGCTALIFIERDAFSDNSLVSVDLSGCEALTTIGSYAFYDNSIASLDFSDCVALKTIGYKSFAFNSIANLNLSGCVALTSIRENAFYENSLTNLNLSTCTALTSIGYGAFVSNSIASLDLSGCKALTIIGEYAFSENSISAIDLSNCTMLTTIGKYAFNNNLLSSFALPVNTEYASYGWKDGMNNIYSGGDEVSTFSISYYIPSSFAVTFIDWDGTVLKTDPTEHGNAATAPADPAREGYTFIGWDVDFNNIVSDLVVTAQYEIVTSVKEVEGITFMVYPNPASSVVNFHLEAGIYHSTNLEIFDFNGRKIFEKQIPTGTENIEVDVRQLKNGVYFCKLCTKKESVTKKLIIQK